MNVDIPIPAEGREQSVIELGRFVLACLPGKPLTVTVSPVKNERSSKQNKALFGHAYECIRRAYGCDKEDLHNDFCIAFFGQRVQSVFDWNTRKPIRTTTHDADGNRDVISAELFSQFYAEVERKGAEFGLFIPSPDPRWFLDFDEKGYK